jgi:hypothetical protein
LIILFFFLVFHFSFSSRLSPLLEPAHFRPRSRSVDQVVSPSRTNTGTIKRLAMQFDPAQIRAAGTETASSSTSEIRVRTPFMTSCDITKFVIYFFFVAITNFKRIKSE